jgi:hypothetical protein
MIVGILILLAAAFALGLFVGYLVWHPNNITIAKPIIAPSTPQPVDAEPFDLPPAAPADHDLSSVAKELAEEYKK